MYKILTILTASLLFGSGAHQAYGNGVSLPQEERVQFHEGLTFKEAKNVAVQSGKPVFIDFYATWCAPCKTMDKEVFTQPSVAGFMNRTFVNLKIDGEKGEGIDLVRQFSIRAYPTFLVLNPDGSEAFRLVGARSAPAFLEELEKGLDVQRSPEMLKSRYEQGERTPALINDYVFSIMRSGDEDAGYKLINSYFHSLTPEQKADPANAFLYERYAKDLYDEKIEYLMANRPDFVSGVGADWVNNLLYSKLRLELVTYANGYRARTGTYDEATYLRLRARIQEIGLEGDQNLDQLVAIADARGASKLPNSNFIYISERVYPKLAKRDRGLLLYSLSDYAEHPDAPARQKAVELLRTYMDEVSEVAQGAMRKILADLEYADQKTNGIEFQDLNFEQALQAASKQDQLIFLDAFTTWCGPCKMMDRQVFARDEVGSFFNPRFINLKIDMEKGEGPALAERYDVRAYPTFLLINSKGELVDRIVGFHDADVLMTKVRKHLDK